MFIYDVIARNTRQYRKAAHMTQEDLAYLCGVTSSYISGLENARRNPTIDMLDTVASALGILTYQLLEESPESPIAPDTLTKARMERYFRRVDTMPPEEQKMFFAYLDALINLMWKSIAHGAPGSKGGLRRTGLKGKPPGKSPLADGQHSMMD